MINDDTTPWRKATASGSSGSCFEFRRRGGQIEVRDSKRGDESPVLQMNRNEMLAMMDGVKKGEFDDLLDGVL